ncbi:MAG: hypothetical protein DCC55_02305 [Chloroflexi bacterium]|nr:MAG: hypothetical protein DCC55_02305 [Chloroflexota bacterium]
MTAQQKLTSTVMKTQMARLLLWRSRSNRSTASHSARDQKASTPQQSRIVPMPAPGLTVWEG